MLLLGGAATAWVYQEGSEATAAKNPVQSDLAPYTVVVAGIDSLTDGAGGTDWRRYFRQELVGELGDGGPGWASFSERGAEEHGADFKYGGTFRPFHLNTPHGSSSLDGEGIAASDGGTFAWSGPEGWDKARIFYRAQPDGGTLTCGNGGVADTSGSGIGWIDVRGSIQCSASGNVTAFGALLLSDEPGLVVVNMARGGRKLADVAAQDSELRTQWFAALLPDVFLLNAGTNDWRDDTPATHEAGLRKVIQAAHRGAPEMQTYLVEHNAFGGTQDAAGSERHLANAAVKKGLARELGLSVIEVRDVLGAYSSARASGLIMDTVHPSDQGNQLLGRHFARQVRDDLQ
ncbi:SGNH/GDSL hydrolase family protein [Pelagerythrobacter aerophilus]|uniref:SGNH/GDSL hydrolase family protein n=1 Tax=Pelagerythrobacter aerophilus TaxID=2306995 RepID=UPI00160317C1|nr:SGNH/GDSL hydrolase family protein [Pelagerythrobacter aerophilus]